MQNACHPLCTLQRSVLPVIVVLLLGLLTACTDSSISGGGSPSAIVPATGYPLPQTATPTLGTATAGHPSLTVPPPSPPSPSPSALPTDSGTTPPSTSLTNPASHIRTVFVIVMENHNWSEIKGSRSAPYINKTLLPQAAHAEQYYNPPGVHPSEPNYLWLEAGTSFGISNDNAPAANHQSTADHLVTLLDKSGISWKAYQEGISGKVCPLTSTGLYAPKHNPMVFFEDVTGGNDPSSAYCIAHERPYTELQTDLQSGAVARYNFITPNLCHDMHNSVGCSSLDSVRNGDDWLSQEVPKITGSQAYRDGGVLFITWDEGEGGSDGPIGMIVLSPFAKGSGYSNSIHYTHSSTLRTVEEIFGVSPLLADAVTAKDLSDLFRVFP